LNKRTVAAPKLQHKNSDIDDDDAGGYDGQARGASRGIA
jgi:hypothetical protein